MHFIVTAHQQNKERTMNAEQAVESQPKYATPGVMEVGEVTKVTLGKYAEDTRDQGRYFE